MSEPIVVLTNCPDDAVADRIARTLVESGLAACVNRLAPVASVYRWRGAVERATETPLLIKTRVLIPQPEVNYAFTGEAGYMFPRPDGIVIGGSYERGKWEAEVQPERIARIIASHQALFAGFRCPA